jgi:DNA-binding NarL/FixJ family response regulator
MIGDTPRYDPLAPAKKAEMIFGLSSNLNIATKLAQSAKICHASVHNFDRAEGLIARLKEDKPLLVAMDLDTREAEAFKVLKELRGNAEFKSIAAVGFVSAGVKTPVREEAQRAGCHRVYTKTEFIRDMDTILARYVKP